MWRWDSKKTGTSAAARFSRRWAMRFRRRPTTVAQARARANEPLTTSVKVAILWDPETPEEESKIWLAYLFARGAFAANETAGGPAVGERESTFDEEVRGRQIALAHLPRFEATTVRHRNQPISTTLIGWRPRASCASTCGATCGIPPGRRRLRELDVAGFDAWRAEHLTNHKAGDPRADRVPAGVSAVRVLRTARLALRSPALILSHCQRARARRLRRPHPAAHHRSSCSTAATTDAGMLPPAGL